VSLQPNASRTITWSLRRKYAEKARRRDKRGSGATRKCARLLEGTKNAQQHAQDRLMGRETKEKEIVVDLVGAVENMGVSNILDTDKGDNAMGLPTRKKKQRRRVLKTRIEKKANKSIAGEEVTLSPEIGTPNEKRPNVDIKGRKATTKFFEVIGKERTLSENCWEEPQQKTHKPRLYRGETFGEKQVVNL